MKSNLFFLVLAATVISVSSCNLVCVDGTGDETTVSRNTGEFSKVELDLNAELTIVKGSYPLEIIAQQNIADEIKTEVRGNKIRIYSDRCLNYEGIIRIKAGMNDIEALELSGAGNITVADTIMVKSISIEINGSGNINAKLIASELNCDISGSGNMNLTGSANKIVAEINGSGDIHGENMPCNTASLEINGSGDIETYVLQSLKAFINGSGSIKYRGNPKVKSEINGSGKVNSVN